ncbi:hypothetical protein [Aquimarina sp. 433]
MLKTIIFTFILVISSLQLYSQNDYIKLDNAKTQKPTYIFNKKIIGNEYLFFTLGVSDEEIKKQIKDISILKDKRNRRSYDDYNLTEHGLLMVDLSTKISSKTQTELNDFFGLAKGNNIYIDGYLLENKKYSVAISSIYEIEIIRTTNTNRKEDKFLNIWTLPKNERYRKDNN